jgi:predicted dehydrogenase
MFRFCLVGFGRWGKIYYNTILELDWCTIDSIVLSGKNENKLNIRNIPTFNSIEEVIKERRVDGFIIATPPHTHFNIAKLCLENKYSILVEKPFTDNFEQACNILHIAKKNNTLCMVGFQHLLDVNYIYFKQIISKLLNNTVIYSESLSNGPIRNNVSVLRDWGSHEIAIALNLFDEKPIYYSIKKIDGEKNDDYQSIFYMELEFNNNNKYISIFGNISEVKRRTLVGMNQNVCIILNGLDQGGCVIIENGSLKNPESISLTTKKPVEFMLKNFVSKSKFEKFDYDSSEKILQVISMLDRIELKHKAEN